MKVLIVENEPQIAEGIDLILKEQQHRDPCETHVSSNGVQGLLAAEKLHPDLILTDIRMSDMDGLRMIKEIKQRKIQTQIVVISGYRDFEYVQAALRLHILDYLLKPIDKQRLQNLVHQVYASLSSSRMATAAPSLPHIPELEETMDLSSCPPVLKKILVYIEKNYMNDISLHSISDELMLHVCYLSTLINNHSGHSFNYHVNRIRLKKACELLLFEPDLSTEDISYLVGYKHVRRLYNSFQSYLGMTPGKFREAWSSKIKEDRNEQCK